jgi:prepilin-type N-terminal cleavage/methylation domain-containing protein
MNGCGSEKRAAIPARRIPRGFTLLELLVVVAILAVLFAILIPVITSAIDKANIVSCFSNMRQIGAGFTLYQADHKGRYPTCGYDDFRGGPYGVVGILASYFPFGTMVDKNGNLTEWVDSRYTCPMYKKKNRDYNPQDLNYGSYAYRHAFRGKWSGAGRPPPEPEPSGSTLGGRMTAELSGNPYAGAYSIFHWTPNVYGIVWDNGWIDSKVRTEPHNYYGIPGHAPYFHVLFADLHVAKHEWVHRQQTIPANQSPNVPPEYRSDGYKLNP